MAKGSEVREFVHENGYLELIKDENGKEKVRCKLTGHQLPCRLSDIIAYTTGKKYQRLIIGMLKSSQQEQFVPDDYTEYLVPSNKNKNQLYCKVTKRLINNIPHHIKQHVTGKRFQRQLKIYKESLEAPTDYVPRGICCGSEKRPTEEYPYMVPEDASQDSSNEEQEKLWKSSESESEQEEENDRLSDSFMDEEEEEEDDDMETDKTTPEKKTKSTTNKDTAKETKRKPMNTRKRPAKDESQTKTAAAKKKKTSNPTKQNNNKTKRKKT